MVALNWQFDPNWSSNPSIISKSNPIQWISKYCLAHFKCLQSKEKLYVKPNVSVFSLNVFNASHGISGYIQCSSSCSVYYRLAPVYRHYCSVYYTHTQALQFQWRSISVLLAFHGWVDAKALIYQLSDPTLHIICTQFSESSINLPCQCPGQMATMRWLAFDWIADNEVVVLHPSP